MASGSRTWIFVLIVIFILLFISMFLAGIIASLLGGGIEASSMKGSVALIPVKGFITADRSSGFLGEQYVSSTDTIELIEKAEKNPSIKAIVFEINSGGGSAVASEEIVEAAAKIKKPTASWIREVGASGAYWIASETDYIIASRMSFVGSIGVLSSYLEFSGLLDDYNITYQRLVGGKYKDIGSPFKELTNDEEQMLNKRISSMHNYFIDSIVKNRKLTEKQAAEISTAAFYTGEESLSIGLVDKLGGKEEVTAYLEKEHGIKAEYVEYRKKRSFLEGLAEVFSSFSFNLGQGMSHGLFSKDALKAYAK